MKKKWSTKKQYVVRINQILYLPIHTILPQNRRRDGSRGSVSPLTHLRLSHTRRTNRPGDRTPTECVEVIFTLVLEAPQRILCIVEAPPPLPSNRVLVKVNAVRSHANKVILVIRETMVSEFALPLHRAVYKEDKDHERNSTKSADDTDDGILPLLAAIIFHWPRVERSTGERVDNGGNWVTAVNLRSDFAVNAFEGIDDGSLLQEQSLHVGDSVRLHKQVNTREQQGYVSRALVLGRYNDGELLHEDLVICRQELAIARAVLKHILFSTPAATKSLSV